jgi:DNA-binding NarL/FixJ family response regulator
MTEMTGTTEPVRVLLADDQRVVREGLAMLLGLLPDVEVAGVAADGEEALDLAARLRPDIVLMDLRMPRCDGVSATRLLRDRAPDIAVIVLTTYADDRSVIDALRAGARGYLTKDAGAAEIHSALRKVTSGHAVIDPVVQRHLVQAIAEADAGASPGRAGDEPVAGPAATPTTGPTAGPAAGPALPDGLTRREAEVLSLIAAGLSNAEIAARLVVSEATVKSHINHLLAKIGARDRAQAVGYAYRNNLAPPHGHE